MKVNRFTKIVWSFFPLLFLIAGVFVIVEALLYEFFGLGSAGKPLIPDLLASCFIIVLGGVGLSKIWLGCPKNAPITRNDENLKPNHHDHIMSESEQPLYIEGGVIYQEGYSAGYSGKKDISGNPYPATIWMGEVWLEGYREGEFARLSLSEPSLATTMHNV